MSLTQYYTATTLDGFIADPENSLDWLFTRKRGGRAVGRGNAFDRAAASRGHERRHPSLERRVHVVSLAGWAGGTRGRWSVSD